MANIVGTATGETLAGTASDDLIEALGGNDTVNAGAGNDTIIGGIGNDILNGEDGDDLFVQDVQTVPLDLFNGGTGTDTIELRVIANPVVSSIGIVSPHIMNGATSLTSIERVVFASTQGNVVQGIFLLSALPSTGLTELVGGAGRDLATFTNGTLAGTFTIPTLTYTGFGAAAVNAWEAGQDAVTISAAGSVGASITINANSAVNVLQILAGGAGNDTINGSSRGDVLIGNAGTDLLNGNDGNDAIQIVNSMAGNPTNGTFGPETALNGLGSTYNGGNGTDTLLVGGTVNLLATLQGIERIQLLPEFTPPVANTAKQLPTNLTLDSARLAMLPGTTQFAGTGTVWFAIDDGASFSAAGYTFDTGAQVAFNILAGDGDGLVFTGSSIGERITLRVGTQTAIGGGGDDVIEFGQGSQTATGGAGADGFGFAAGSGRVTDFTQGEDYVDLRDSGISNWGRLTDLDAAQVANETRLSGSSGGQNYQLVLENVALANLTLSDFRLDQGGYAVVDFGTSSADLLYGFSLNDDLRGGDGNDRLYSGGGVDQLRGEGGDDVIVLDGATLVGTTIDGGTGFDELVLRGTGSGPITHLAVTTVAGMERLTFDSQVGETITGVVIAPALIGGSMNVVSGGAGADSLVAVAGIGGSYNLGALTLQNWDVAGGDRLTLFAAAAMTSDVNFVARTDIGGQALIGALGNDTLVGSGFSDVLRGNAGSDSLQGQGGADAMFGGLGNDSYFVDTQSDLAFENVGEGTDAIISTVSFYLYENIEGLYLSDGSGAFYGVGNGLDNTLGGNEIGNLLLAGAGNDLVNAGAGNDVVYGEDGVDTLNGDAGIDYLIAGAGNDILDGGDNADALFGEDGDDVLFGGTSFDTDILIGGAGNDVLDGRSDQVNPEQDLMDGGIGNDTYFVDTGADLTFEGVGEGTDTVIAEVNVPNAGVYLYGNVENLILAGTTAFGVGNGLNNVITGSDSGNWLLGGAGDDVINGLAGDDVLFGEAGEDQFVFVVGTGSDVIGDFQSGTDKISLIGYQLDFTQLQTLFVQVGNVGAIQMTGGDVIVLHNVTMANLSASDFIFG